MRHLNKQRPKWMQDFHIAHGVWPIAGGSDDEDTPPGDTVTIETPKPPPAEDPAKEGFAAGRAEAEAGKTFTADDLERVRKEEKDKLYGRISSMEETLAAAKKAEEERLRLVQEEESKKAAEASKRAEEEMDVRELLQTKEQEWQQRFQQVESELQTRDAMLAKEREFSQLQQYREAKLKEHENEIMPQLRDLVSGGSPEEIDSAINTMRERTSSILEEVKQYRQTQRQQMPGVKPTAPPLGGPLEQNETVQQTVTAEQIRAMSVNDYAKVREKLLGAASQSVSQRGLYNR